MLKANEVSGYANVSFCGAWSYVLMSPPLPVGGGRLHVTAVCFLIFWEELIFIISLICVIVVFSTT
jgi:hypothetical protein